ncbi:D-2-hydroxyacid dehydrogenase [Filibacter tadaridae]|uniref:2-hydroxyacid dehydrogenase YoaD n=1 Tax=Filibacter tadaridae TaxID=2483811 RepID=A0A3P5WW47_9BACL|nr:D-2-hydroxyacid dehydrogenase [Filibacter tadaridae]VDC22716.1 Putative 2-hydroxyacid dehydrogenase YoaD [Filibacter tadaridae]
MEVVFTFNIKDHQKENLRKTFRDVTFHFDEKMEGTKMETATVIVTYGDDVDDGALDRAKSLKWLMVASAGMEKIPFASIAKQEILLTNVRGIHKTPMAETVLAHILALKRSLPLIYERQKNKEWSRNHSSSELKGSTAIILGPGAIGSEIGRLLQAFDVRTIGCNRSGRDCASMDEIILFADLESRLPDADYVISVLPSTPETKGLLTEAHFDSMKDSAVFMNFGRGDLLDEEILIKALKTGKIGHAVLDVFQTEPLPVENELWTLPNCTVSPHVSSLSGKYVDRALILFEENLVKFQNGGADLVNRIELDKGY